MAARGGQLPVAEGGKVRACRCEAPLRDFGWVELPLSATCD
jgi:hypothetical protein